MLARDKAIPAKTPARPTASRNSEPALAQGITTAPSTQRRCPCGGGCPRCRGNLIQAKLTVNAAGDAYEQQADRVAQRVMGISAPDGFPDRTPSAASRPSAAAPAIVDEVLQSRGQPLDAATRAFMEPRFGHDFSAVRVHTDDLAAASAQSLEAQAYASGTHVAFAKGRYRPNTVEGRSLLAHELAHVVQQSGGVGGSIQRRPDPAPAVRTLKPKIVAITAFEGSTDAAVAYVFYPADPDSDTTGGIRSERIRIVKNDLKPGEYTLRHDPRAASLYTWSAESGASVAPGNFTWKSPSLDESKYVAAYDHADTVKITIVPGYVRSFLESDRGPKAAATDLTGELEAAEILVKGGITRDDLLMEQHRAHDHFIKAEEVDPVLWAKSLAGARAQAEGAALKNRKGFLAAAVRLSRIRPADVKLAVQYLTDPDQANEATAIMEIQRGDRVSVYPYLPNTDFEDRRDFWSTLETFLPALDFELRALAEAVLNSTELAVLQVDSMFTGIYGGGSGTGPLERELVDVNKDPQVGRLVKAIRYEEAHPPRLDPVTDLQDDGEDTWSLHSIARHANPMLTFVVDQNEANKEHDLFVDQLKKQLNDLVVAKSRLKVAGIKGFDAYDFLPKSASKVQTQLSSALADARRRVGDARRMLHDDDKFVYGADKIIALEKAQLHLAPGSSLSQIIDGVVGARLAGKSVWESIWSVIDLLIETLPIPPPAGPILRAVAAGINIGQSFEKYAAESLAADISFKSEGPSAAALGLDFVITAAGSIADVATIQSHVASSASRELNAGEREIALDAAAARDADRAGFEAVSAERDVDTAEKSIHVPSTTDADDKLADELGKALEDHPPAAKDIHGSPGHQEAEFVPGHKVVEVPDENTLSGIGCEIHSKRFKTVCPEGLGDRSESFKRNRKPAKAAPKSSKGTKATFIAGSANPGPGETLVGSSQSQMRAKAREIILETDDHPLSFLLTKSGEWKAQKGTMRQHSRLISRPDLVEMGHIVSNKTGEPERIMIQGAWENQLNNISIEHPRVGGAVLSQEAVSIGGIAVERATAEFWEKIGWLDAGTVSGAPVIR